MLASASSCNPVMDFSDAALAVKSKLSESSLASDSWITAIYFVERISLCLRSCFPVDTSKEEGLIALPECFAMLFPVDA